MRASNQPTPEVGTAPMQLGRHQPLVRHHTRVPGTEIAEIAEIAATTQVVCGRGRSRAPVPRRPRAPRQDRMRIGPGRSENARGNMTHLYVQSRLWLRRHCAAVCAPPPPALQHPTHDISLLRQGLQWVVAAAESQALRCCCPDAGCVGYALLAANEENSAQLHTCPESPDGAGCQGAWREIYGDSWRGATDQHHPCLMDYR